MAERREGGEGEVVVVVRQVPSLLAIKQPMKIQLKA